MPEKDPNTYSFLTYLWVIVLSAWGGAVNYMRNIKHGRARPWNFAELIGEIVTSGFVGVLTFYLCQAAEMNGVLTAAMVGISGHMGSRALFLMEKWITSKLCKSGDC